MTNLNTNACSFQSICREMEAQICGIVALSHPCYQARIWEWYFTFYKYNLARGSYYAITWVLSVDWAIAFPCVLPRFLTIAPLPEDSWWHTDSRFRIWICLGCLGLDFAIKWEGLHIFFIMNDHGRFWSGHSPLSSLSLKFKGECNGIMDGESYGTWSKMFGCVCE